MRKCVFLAAAILAVALCVARLDASVVLGQSDTFQTSDAMGWTIGPNGGFVPAVISTGGPQGANDGYLQLISTGGSKQNSKLVMYNPFQWTGNFVSAGVTRMDLDMANFGPNALSMRVGFQDNVGSEFSSTVPYPLPADGQWHHASFDMSPSAFTLIQGGSTASQALSNVGVLRLLSSTNPAYIADTIAATVGFDNITAVPEPGVGGVIAGCALLLVKRRR